MTNEELIDEIMSAFYTKFDMEEFTIHPQEPGRTLQNLINNEKGRVLFKAIEFTINYMEKKK